VTARPDPLAVISRAIQVFDTPGFRLLVDRSEFAVDAGNLYGDLLAAYTAIAYRDSEIAALVEAARNGYDMKVEDGTVALYFEPRKAEKLRAALAAFGATP